MRAHYEIANRATSVRSAAAVVLLTIAATSTARGQSMDRRTLSGSDIAIYNLVGSIHAEAGSGSDVAVEVTRHGADAARLHIESGELRGRQTLRVVYPDRRIVFAGLENRGRRTWFGDSRTTIDVDDDGTFGDTNHSGRHRVEIVAHGSGLEASADVRVLVPRGRRVALHLAAGEATVTNVDGDILVDVSQATVTTSGTSGRLTLDTGSGSVRVSDAEGQVVLDSGSGDVVVMGMRGDRMRLDAGSGSVRAERIEVARLDVDSGSGSVRLTDVRAPDISLDAGSGSVEIGLLATVASMKIDSGSGSVTIDAPKSLDAELVAETGSGGIRVDLPMQVRKRDHGYLAARIGDGRGRISIDAGSGTVTIRER